MSNIVRAGEHKIEWLSRESPTRCQLGVVPGFLRKRVAD